MILYGYTTLPLPNKTNLFTYLLTYLNKRKKLFHLVTGLSWLVGLAGTLHPSPGVTNRQDRMRFIQYIQYTCTFLFTPALGSPTGRTGCGSYSTFSTRVHYYSPQPRGHQQAGQDGVHTVHSVHMYIFILIVTNPK